MSHRIVITHSSFRYEEREAEEVIKKLDKLEVSKDSQEKCEKEEAEENTRKEEKDVKEPEINGTPGRLRTMFWTCRMVVCSTI